MEKIVNTKEYLDMICSLLDEGQRSVPVPVAGSSMTPFLHNGDTVYLDRSDGRLKKGDIVLYTRPTGQYVLHRIVKRNADGSLVMLGDAQTERERLADAGQIHGKVIRAVHRGKLLTSSSLRWQFFATVWIWVRPWRQKLMRLSGILKKNNR